VPYLDADVGVPLVLFLARPTDGESARLLTAFPVDGSLGREKVASLERQIALAAIPDPDARARATVAYLLEAQKANGTWTRVHAARELNHLVRVWPRVFDDEAREALATAARGARVPSQRTWLVRVLETLRCVVPPSERAPEAPPDVRRLRDLLAEAEDRDGRVKVFREVLERGGRRGFAVAFRVLPEVDAEVREQVVDLLGEGGWSDALEPVRALYATEPSVEVQRAVVRAVGRLGGGAAVPWLEDRTRSLRVQREALFALARIRTPEALSALRRFRDRAAVSSHGDKDVTALVDYLLGPAFEEIEAVGRGVPR
jgi:hypothetical protein